MPFKLRLYRMTYGAIVTYWAVIALILQRLNAVALRPEAVEARLVERVLAAMTRSTHHRTHLIVTLAV